jgi:hypothetical protein
MTNLSTELARLAEEATPGEWATSPDHVSDQDYETCIELTDRVGHIGTAIAYFHHDWETDRISWKAAQSNTALCVTLRNAVPEILTALRAQQHAEALARKLEAITAMQSFRHGDATGTHLALSVLCETARAALAAYRSVK